MRETFDYSITSEKSCCNNMVSQNYNSAYPSERLNLQRSPAQPGEDSVDISFLMDKGSELYDRTGALIGAENNASKQEASGKKEIEEDGESLTGEDPAEEEKTIKSKAMNDEELTEEEKSEVRELKQRDSEVRSHEQAHMAAGGNLVRGGAHYEYQQGPDGRRYAVGGEVSIDTSSEKTPDQTIQKMIRVKAAALAPADPSTQDRAVAASASQKAAAARMEKIQAGQSQSAPAATEQAEDGHNTVENFQGSETQTCPREKGSTQKSFQKVI